VVSALQADGDPAVWLDAMAPRAKAFNGFNLLVGDAVVPRSGTVSAPRLHYVSNRLEAPSKVLSPGIYGLSNAFLDTPWPKVTRAVGAFACQIAQRVRHEDLFTLLADRQAARDHELPQTGVPLDWERVLSAIQIRANGYGTRTSTVLTVRRDGLVNFIERSFDPEEPERYRDRSYEFMVAASEVSE
jgi:uncharacterized protein with NRDE domain